MKTVTTLDQILQNKQELFWTQDQVFDALNNKTKIVEYEDLERYSDIDELLGEYNNVVLFIPVSERTKGHWICIIKNAHGIEFFDSYGQTPSQIIERCDYIHENDIPADHLERLLMTVDSPIINRHVFQETSNDVNTCGRHVSLRIFFSMLSNDAYKRFMTTKKYSYDDLAVLMTMLV